MKKEAENQINSFKTLAFLTMNPILITAYLHVRRTGKTLTLDSVGLEKEIEQTNSL